MRRFPELMAITRRTTIFISRRALRDVTSPVSGLVKVGEGGPRPVDGVSQRRTRTTPTLSIHGFPRAPSGAGKRRRRPITFPHGAGDLQGLVDETAGDGGCESAAVNPLPRARARRIRRTVRRDEIHV